LTSGVEASTSAQKSGRRNFTSSLTIGDCMEDHDCKKPMNHHMTSGSIYGLAFIGAAIYFIQHAASFWEGALGLLKAMLWPAVLVYKLLEFLKL
jgi:hypothetical protein